MLHSVAIKHGARSAATFLCVLWLAACNAGGMPGGTLPPPDMMITSQKAPPPAKSETAPPPPPGPANYFVWDPGHWHWTGQDYVWIAGHYVESPYQRAVWVPGSWSYNGALSWTWTPGHWS